MPVKKALCILIAGLAWLNLHTRAAQSQRADPDLDVSSCDRFEAQLRRSVSLAELALAQHKQMRDRFAAILQRREESDGKVEPRARQLLERMEARVSEAEEKLKQNKQQLMEYRWQSLRR